MVICIETLNDSMTIRISNFSKSNFSVLMNYAEIDKISFQSETEIGNKSKHSYKELN